MRALAILVLLVVSPIAAPQAPKKPTIKPLNNCAAVIAGCKQIGAWGYVADTDELTDEKKLTAINVAENGSQEMLVYQCKGGAEVLVLILGLNGFTLDHTKTFIFRFDADPAFEQTWKKLPRKSNEFFLTGEPLNDFMQMLSSRKKLLVAVGESVKRFSLAGTGRLFAIREERCRA